MAQPPPFHTPPYHFPQALPAQLVRYWLDYLRNFRGPNPLQTVFDDETNQLVPLDPPMVNGPRIVPAPFNGPFPIKSKDPKTGRLKQEVGAGVFVGFLLIPGGDGSLVWDPNNWCAVYGKMGKYPSKNYHKSAKARRPRRKCTFSAKDRNYLSADTELGMKGKIVAFERIFLIQQLRGQSKAQVEDYVASGETRSRKDGLREYDSQMLHLRSLQNAHLVSLPAKADRDRLADQYNR